MEQRPSQRVQFCTARDGAKIAYAVSGEGYPLVRAAHYLSHLEFDFESPVWRHWIRELSRFNTYVRYDERGCGLSDWNPPEFSFDAWVSDLETVVDSLGLDKFDLLGVSQGGSVSIVYTVQHPERVSHLVLYGAYGQGWGKRKGPKVSSEALERRQAMHRLVELGWGQDNPAFRQMFTSLFIPDGGPEQQEWFNELQRVSCTPKNASKFDAVFADIDVSQLLQKVSVPTLILQARQDGVVPFEQGRLLASRIPQARFISFEGRNHILLETEPGWKTFLQESRQFLGVAPGQVSLGRPSNIVEKKVDPAEISRIISQMNDVSLSKFAIVGSYVRYQSDARNRLKDLKQKLLASLQSRSLRPQNYLLWAPPGTGKSFFVQEVAKSLGDSARYEEFNLAELDEQQLKSKLTEINIGQKPLLCLIDEIDAKSNESWPFELLLPSLEQAEARGPKVFVLVGSSTSGIGEMKQRMSTRQKGPDLLSRIPAENESEIPPLGAGDSALVVLAQLRNSGRRLGKPIKEVEKFAVYYVCLNDRLYSARRLRDFANQCVERLPRGEDRVKYDNLFGAGDPVNKEFWVKNEHVRMGLVGEFISVSD